MGSDMMRSAWDWARDLEDREARLRRIGTTARAELAREPPATREQLVEALHCIARECEFLRRFDRDD